jgi:hypothetical protein
MVYLSGIKFNFSLISYFEAIYMISKVVYLNL